MDREEAIKEMREKLPWLTEDTKRLVEALIPELRESEDERALEMCISAVNIAASAEGGLLHHEAKQCLEYLEKQKVFSEHGEGVYYYHRDGSFTFISTPTVDNPYDFAMSQQEKQKESLHIHETCKENADPFTDEDERIRKELVNFILYKAGHLLDEETEHKFIAYLEKQKVNTEGDFARGYDCGYECCLNSHGAEWFEKQKEQPIPLMNGDADLYFDNWIQHNDTTKRGCFEEGIRYAQRLQKEQKPAGWSEEDQLNLNWGIAILNGEPCDLDIQLESLISWLKSLRPSWKPTEEQMKALYEAAQEAPIDKEDGPII